MKDYSKYGFREHGLMLYLDKKLYSAFIRLQADRNLGRSYAGLLAFVEGMFHLGFISKEEYLEYSQKYSQKLDIEQIKEKPVSPEIQQKQKEFVNILKQWDNAPEKSKNYYFAKAEKFKDLIPEAIEILKKYNQLS